MVQSFTYFRVVSESLCLKLSHVF